MLSDLAEILEEERILLEDAQKKKGTAKIE
jgi:hypothetical protein